MEEGWRLEGWRVGGWRNERVGEMRGLGRLGSEGVKNSYNEVILRLVEGQETAAYKSM